MENGNEYYLDNELFTIEENIDWQYGEGWFEDISWIDVDQIDKELKEEDAWMDSSQY